MQHLCFWKQENPFSLSLLHLLFIAVPGQNVQSKCLNLIWSLDKLRVRKTYFKYGWLSAEVSVHLLYLPRTCFPLFKRVLTRGKVKLILLMGPLGPLGSVFMKGLPSDSELLVITERPYTHCCTASSWKSNSP